jgi:hypothetical protein
MKLFTGLSILIISISFFSCTHQSQKNITDKKSLNSNDWEKINTDSIVKEGYELYHLERASWISTDLLKEKFSNIKYVKGFAGYITYHGTDNIISTYWKNINDENKIFITYKFNSNADSSSVSIDNSLREPNNAEKYFFSCRNRMLKLIIDSNKYFQAPEGCSFNFIFLKDKDRLRIIALTGPTEPGIVPFGNDFQFIFDHSGEFLYGGLIHSAMVNLDKPEKCPSYDPVKIEMDNDGNSKLCSHYHHASIPKFITSTDICNFLLYGKGDYFAVYSRDYVSLFTKNDSPKLGIWTNEYFKEHFINK